MKKAIWSMCPVRNVAVALGASIAVTAAAGPSERFPIDLAALRAEAAERFNAADADGDGVVNSDEFAAVDVRRLMGKDRKRGREHGAGTASRRSMDAEHRRQRLAARAEKREGEFTIADADGDGRLSKEEFRNLPAAVHAERQRRLFSRLDADGDGALAASEFPSRAIRLARFDANGDGQITADEMRKRQRR